MSLDTLFGLVDLVSEALCSVQPYTVEQVKAELSLAVSEQRKMLIEPNPLLMQGDILKDLTYPNVNEQGEVEIVSSDVIVLSNSCDCQRNKELLFAPIIPLDNVSSAKEMNFHYDLMAIDEAPLKGMVIDFSKTFSMNSLIVNDRLKNKIIKKTKSLSLFGIHLLYLKLTVFLMRPIGDEEKELKLSSNTL